MSTPSIRRIGILTGGGDCPGLNAVIRAVAKTAIIKYGLEVVGIEDGFLGLIENRCRRLEIPDVSNILTLGGTILGTNNNTDPLKFPVTENGERKLRDVTDRCIDHLNQRGVDAVVVIGGDGTMSAAAPLVTKGVNCIGVPKTIDNDLFGSDVTFGFATARSIATEALDRVHTTAASHHRAMVVELMGRNAGWLTLEAGVASGADIILIPEIPYDIGKVCDRVLERSRHGKRFSILAVSEGARPHDGRQVVADYDPSRPEPVRLGGVGKRIADQIEDKTAVETRVTVLGHVQRGGSPVSEDRVLATQFGYCAMEILMSGRRNRLIVMRGRNTEDVDILSAANRQRLVPADHPLIAAARSVGVSFGD